MPFAQFLSKQLIDILQWNEPEDGILAYRYPMLDQEIQNGGQLVVRESQIAVFVSNGRVADIFGPGLHTLSTPNLPVLTDLNNWDKGFQSPFKSDVYFFSTRLQIDRKWGTATPITLRDQEFGAVRLRGYGIHAFHIADPRLFFTRISGTREIYYTGDLEGQLRNTIVACMTDIFAASDISYLDMTRNQSALAVKITAQLAPAFAAFGLSLDQFTVENISLPDDLQKLLDQRIGMGMVGDLNRYAQFAAAQSLTLAAANPNGAAGLGMGVGVGAALAATLKPAPAAESKFCTACGHSIARTAKFCPDCGSAQGSAA